jgi:hypothetical protein
MPRIGNALVEGFIWRSECECVMAQLAIFCSIGHQLGEAFFRQQVEAAAEFARRAEQRLEQNHIIRKYLGILSNLQPIMDLTGHGDAAAEAAAAGVEIKNLVINLCRRWRGIDKEDVAATINLHKQAALRRWDPGQDKPLTPFLARSAILGARKDLKFKLSKPSDEDPWTLLDDGTVGADDSRILGRTRTVRPTVEPNPRQLGLDAAEELSAILKGMRLTPAERRVIARKCAEDGPLSASEKVAFTRLRKKILSKRPSGRPRPRTAPAIALKNS